MSLPSQDPRAPSSIVVEHIQALAQPDTALAAYEALNKYAGSLSAVALVELRLSVGRIEDAIANTRPKLPGNEPWFDNYVAGTLTDIGLYAAARRHLRAHLRPGRGAAPGDSSNLSLVIGSWTLLANLELASGDGQAAQSAARNALSLCDDAAPESTLSPRADALGVQARVAIELGDLPTAYAMLMEQERLATASKDQNSLLRSSLFRAEFYLALDRATPAIRALDEYTAEKPDPRIEIVRGIAELTATLSGSRPSADTETTLRRALAMRGVPHSYALRGRLALVELALARGELDAAATQLQRARGLAGKATGIGPDTQMMAELESLAARLLRLRHAQTPLPEATLEQQRVKLRAAFDAVLRHFRSFPPAASGHGFLSFNYRRRIVGELIELTRLVNRGGSADEAAQILLDVQSLSTPVCEAGLRRTTVARVQATLLEPDTAVALFFLSVDDSHLIVVDRNQCRVSRLPGWRELAGPLRDFRRALDQESTTDTDALQALAANARRLGDMLLPATLRADLCRFRLVTIADHGTLYGLPWECLEVDDDKLLGEVVAINNLSSLPLAVRAAENGLREPSGAPSVAVIATLQAAKANSASAGYRIPAETVGGLTDPYGSTPWTLLDQDVTPSALRRLRITRTVTQLLAHGAEVIGRGARRGLQLAGGVFGPDDIAAMPEVSGLIMLSSCGTGKSRQRLGEEPYHTTLGGAFLRQGAHTVVQARADLTLGPHLELLRLVHRQLAAGVATAEALRHARDALRGSDLALRFQHAQMQVFGFGHWPAASISPR